MKFGVISDLHLEFDYIAPSELGIAKGDIDFIIFAGDLHPQHLIRQGYLDALEGYFDVPVYQCWGNHDYWGPTPADMDVSFYGHPRDDGGEVRIVSATLWTDLRGHWDLYADGLMDKRQMYGLDWTEEAMRAEHLKGLGAIFDADFNADIVITHHAPSFRSVHPRYARNPYNICFVSDLDDRIINMKHPPKYWVHGHVHDGFDYMLGKTRIICNPRGYPNEPNHLFYGAKVYEI
jgi:Icc-related predicted phosphoesterase